MNQWILCLSLLSSNEKTVAVKDLKKLEIYNILKKQVLLW